MFSSTTIALSTTMPTAKEMPASMTTLMVRPRRVTTRNVPTAQIGMARQTMNVAERLRRKRKRTPGREEGSDQDVRSYPTDRLLHVLGFIVDLFQEEAAVGKDAVVEVAQGDLELAHDLEDVGADVAEGVDRDRRLALVADEEARLLVAQQDTADVVDVDRDIVAPGDDDLLHVRGFDELAHDADDVAPFTLIEVSARDVGVVSHEGVTDVHPCEPFGREGVGIDENLELALAATEDVAPGDPWHAFDGGLHLLDAEVVEGADVELGATTLCVLEDHPSHGVVLAAGGDDRLVGVVRVAGDLRERVLDLDQRLVHVHADAELEDDRRRAVLGLARQLAKALDVLEEPLLFVGDLTLDLDRTPTGPTGLDGDLRHVDVGVSWTGILRSESTPNSDTRITPTATATGFFRQALTRFIRRPRRVPSRPRAGRA